MKLTGFTCTVLASLLRKMKNCRGYVYLETPLLTMLVIQALPVIRNEKIKGILFKYVIRKMSSLIFTGTGTGRKRN